MPENPASEVTEGVRVSVRTEYRASESSPAGRFYVFAYHIEITNESSEAVQLLHRVWHIVESDGEHRLVEGEGVVGQQPLIRPGQTFDYISGCHFHAPIGKMSGRYLMERGEEAIEVEIPPFVMVAPFMLN
ncbi:MAG: Co2+/Mg2+ efflux protein ApaG [Bacteroidetes bacterium]|jgi:ApaG protein|nr:MAG: Co2+/Mg2+ efflux protein ApaG [Bacteroidota bacterium]